MLQAGKKKLCHYWYSIPVMTGRFYDFTCELQSVECVTCKPSGSTSGMHLSCG